MRSLVVVCLLTLACCLRAEPITEWAIWGPGWSRGALGPAWMSHEGRLQPQPGDQDINRGWSGENKLTWQYLQTPGGVIDFLSPQVPAVCEHLRDGNVWAGASVYAHSYIWSDSDQPALLQCVAVGGSRIWLNGLRVTDELVRLQQGWNRLLIRMHSPALISGRERIFATETSPSNWRLRAAITGPQETDVPNLRFAAYDPTRTPVITTDGKPLRLLDRFTRDQGDSPVFWSGEPVQLSYHLQIDTQETKFKDRTPWSYTISPDALTGLGQDYTPGSACYAISPSTLRIPPESLDRHLPAQLLLQVVDYDNHTILSRDLALAYTADEAGARTVDLTFDWGKLPINHYVVFSEFRDSEGRLLLRNRPHSFAVINHGPVTRSQDNGDRVLATVGHWLLGKENAEGRLRFLWRLGVTRQQKLNTGWSNWGIKHDGKGNVTFEPNPKMDALIDAANRLGITVVGDLTTGFILSDRIRDGRFPPNTEAEQLELQRKSQAITDPGQLVLRPYGGRSLPPYGTDAFGKTFEEVARLLTSHYKGRVDIWGGDNETDLHAGVATEQIAIVYAAAMGHLYSGLKRGNPDALYVSPSLCRHNDFTDQLIAHGFLAACDIVDVHAHPINPPDLDAPNIGNSTKEGLGVVSEAFRRDPSLAKPVWYGELSPPLSHSPDGVRGQVSAIVKQLAWAINNPHVTGLSYLVMYNDTNYGWPSGMCNMNGEPRPAVNAISTAARLLDGKQRLAPLTYLNSSIQQLRVADKSGRQTLVLWNYASTRVRLHPVGQASLIDIMGIHETPLTPNAEGWIEIAIDSTPRYVLGELREQPQTR